MLTNNLFKILEHFSRKEMTYFLEFIQSPYFNKHDQVINLVNYLSEIYPKFDEVTCSKSRLWKEIFKKGKEDTSKLSLVFTYTNRLIDKFLAIQMLEENQETLDLWTVRHLRRKKLFNPCQKKISKLGEAVEDKTLRDSQYLQFQIHLEEESDRVIAEQGKLPQDPNLENKQTYLEQYFLAEKIKDGCEILLRNKILRKKTEGVLGHLVFNELTQNSEKYLDQPAISLYWILFQMIEKDSIDDYFRALQMIQESDKVFSYSELQNMYNYLLNFCIGKVNQGVEGFLEELFKLQKLLLEKEIIFSDGYLNEWHFKNIVTIGSRLKETDWVKDFLENYKEKLHPSIAENAYNYNLAYLYYTMNDLDKVQSLLLTVEYTDPRYNLDAKTLLLRTYFDLEENEALFSLVDAFRQLIKRNKIISDASKNGYANLFRLTRKAAKIRYDIGYKSKEKLQEELEKLKLEIKDSGMVFNSQWLQSKLEEIAEEITV
jgi:hypothetical protein